MIVIQAIGFRALGVAAGGDRGLHRRVPSMVIELDFPATVATVLYKRQLGGSPQQHLGECAVLAYAKNYGGTAIIDDSAAVEIATSESITVRGTLWLIISGFKSGLLPREAAEALIDQLAETDMRLPCDGAGLFAWAYREGLLP